MRSPKSSTDPKEAIPTIGAVFEITAGHAFHYLQYAHRCEDGLPLLGVLTEKRTTPAGDVESIRDYRYRYFVIYPVHAAVHESLARFVGMAPVPHEHKEFPRLRAPGPLHPDGTVAKWFIYNVPVTFDYQRLIDPSVRFAVRDLTPEQRRLSIACILSHSVLVERLAADWKPENEI